MLGGKSGLELPVEGLDLLLNRHIGKANGSLDGLGKVRKRYEMVAENGEGKGFFREGLARKPAASGGVEDASHSRNGSRQGNGSEWHINGSNCS